MAIWVPDLSGRRGPKYLQIVEAMADDIASGRLAIGAQLPPHRELAYRLELSPNTTSRAYAEGVQRALLRGEVGRGTFVRETEAPLAAGRAHELRRPTSGPIDLSRNLPSPGLAERHLRSVLAEIGRSDDIAALLDYQTSQDLSRHTEAAIKWMSLHSLDAAPDEIVVTTGAQHGLWCALSALCRDGDLLLTEALSYAPVFAMASRLGLRLKSIPIDDAGLIPERLEEICAHSAPRALYLIPTLHTPTTRTLSEERRRAIADIARRRDMIVIEDDVFGLLKTNRPEAIASHAPERTVYLTSVSKTIAPGLRVGFARAPRDLTPALRHAVNLSVWMTPPMTCEIAARLILDGAAESLAAEQRAIAAERQRLAASVLADLNVVADPCALHIWLELPNGWRSDEFRAAAERRGVLVASSRTFCATGRDAPECVRICLSHEPEEHRLRRGLEQMRQLLALPPQGSTPAV